MDIEKIKKDLWTFETAKKSLDHINMVVNSECEYFVEVVSKNSGEKLVITSGKDEVEEIIGAYKAALEERVEKAALTLGAVYETKSRPAKSKK